VNRVPELAERVLGGVDPRVEVLAKPSTGRIDWDGFVLARFGLLDADQGLPVEAFDGIVHPRARDVRNLTDLLGSPLRDSDQGHETPRLVLRQPEFLEGCNCFLGVRHG